MRGGAEPVASGIDKPTAVRIFDGPVLQFSRWPQSYPERRLIAIGMVEGVETTVVYHQKAADLCRIISARLSKRKERLLYAQVLTPDR